MIAAMFKFSHPELGTTLSGLFGVCLAVFGDRVLSTTIALLIVLNLLAGLVVSIRKFLRARQGA
jgi:hypothetical protein